MSVFAVTIVAQAAGLLLMSLLSASILPWRARTSRGWSVNFRPAYVLSLKAGLAAPVTANVAVLAAVARGDTNAKLLKNAALPIGLATWWFVNSRALSRFAAPEAPPTSQEACAMSATVFAYIAGALSALAAALTLVVMAL